METWHRLMDRYNIELIKNKIEKLNIKNPYKICSYKMKNNPYHKTSNKTKAPFQLTHMNITISIYGIIIIIRNFIIFI